VKTPVTIYVVHHPECKEAKELASRLFHWFRLSSLSGESSGGAAGLPVYFRRQLAKKEFVPKINFDHAGLNVVILLVDHRMVAQPEWLKAVVDLASQIAEARKTGDGDRYVQLLPVALHESFYRTGPLYQEFNPIRLLDLTPAQQEAVLRRSATESIARVLRADDDGNPQPLDVFLSHAKRDGKQIAESLRDGIRQVSQLVAWYDANDLPYGADWKSPMETAAARGTAAMIATVTDAYPTRPWCRREAKLARTPALLSERRGCRIWHVQPVVAVHRPQSGWARSIPMLESVPRIGWNTSRPDSQIARIVDRLVLEVLLTRVHCKVAEELESRDRERGLHLESCYLTWVPDSWTLSVVRQALKRQASRVRRIVYPGYGLTTAEEKELKPVISGFHPHTELVSYEEAWQ
jgi:hypothetical protein